MFVTATNGVAFQSRATAGATTTDHGNVQDITAPCWVKLVKTGTSFAGYYAIDNNGQPDQWTQVGTTTANIGANSLIGLAATAHTTAASLLGSSSYDHVSGPQNVGGNRMINITPAADQTGNAVITVTAGDGAAFASTAFNLSVIFSPGAAWRLQYFGTSSNTGDAADFADPDEDGLCNLLEFALHSDPTNANTTPPVVGLEDDTLTLSYTRSKASLAKLSFAVEWAASPGGPWHPENVTELILSDDGTIQHIKAVIPMNGATKLFLRLHVTPL